MYEVFLTRQRVGADEWGEFLRKVLKVHNQGEKVELILRFDGAMLEVFLKTRREFRVSADGFMMQKTDALELAVAGPSVREILMARADNVVVMRERFRAHGTELLEIHTVVRKIAKSQSLKMYAVVAKDGVNKMMRIPKASLALLDVDLKKNYLLKRSPKYLNMAKTLRLMTTDRAGAVLEMNTYPYLEGEHYLNLKNYDFYKHTAVFGASGAGKTKFLAQMISEIAEKYGDKYHVLVVDPHDALKAEIGGLAGAKVYDFSTKERGLDLFAASEQEIVNSVEATLGLFKSLILEGWNARLERLLRAALYLLILEGELSLRNLRRLLTDVAYKNAVLAEVGEYLPESLQEFFGQDFNELKTQYYDVTFARVLSFVDELQLVPAFYRKNDRRLDYELTENKVTLVSLNAAKLGEKAVKTLAGLLMNQLFALGLQRRLGQQVILVVDEVAVVENPILMRMLSEARKYNISVVVAGQYFSQVSEELRMAMFANVVNYCCFRMNYTDAELLAKYLDMDLLDGQRLDAVGAGKEDFEGSMEEKIKLVATLPEREVVMRVARNGVVLPAVRGKSLDFEGVPEARGLEAGAALAEAKFDIKKAPVNIPVKKAFGVKNSIFDLMREQSTSRRKLNG
ncbi:DUF87 domain-containing protein [Candidatus Saccharibacteria bacterium]|nr:DUF87 domain-containing protein [Candidatus Saccharibacteria bacterium]